MFARTARLASHLPVCDGDLTVRKSDPKRIDPLGQLSAGCAWDVGEAGPRMSPRRVGTPSPHRPPPACVVFINVLSARSGR